MNQGKFRFSLSTTQKIILGFFLVVLLGSVLLALPITHQPGNKVSYVDALFMSTTATCVTGLTTLPVYTTWNFLGQLIILLLIQIGGLGVITFLTLFMLSLHKRLGLNERIMIQSAFNLNTLSGLVRFVKKVFLGTMVVEGIGALLYLIVFIPDFGLKGIWIAIFTSISAFCNAGIDLIGENSLCAYVTNPVVNIVTCLLIVLGGIGYVVWWDVIATSRQLKKSGLRCYRQLTLHSKITLSVTAVLVFGGALAILLFDYKNPDTLGPYSFLHKCGISLFQSVTTRTAGFYTIPQQHFSNGSAFVSVFMMFIGGSPVGTAGGIKTVTFAVLVLSLVADVRNKKDVDVFNRTIARQAISRSLAIFGMSFSITFLSTLLLSACCDAPALDILYEAVSATATVGLTRNLTGTLNLFGKIIIIVTMFFGRIGPISLAFAFKIREENKNTIKNPTEEISIG